MNQIAWCTDLHLNRMSLRRKQKFLKGLDGYDSIILSGDNSVATELLSDLELIKQHVQKVYFVLGNHDFYHSSFAGVRSSARSLPEDYFYLTGLTTLEIGINIDGTERKAALIGDDGWYDARCKAPWTRLVFWLDWKNIADFNEKAYAERLMMCRELAWEASQRVLAQLLEVVKYYEYVYLVTHFPPWQQKYRLDMLESIWSSYDTNKYLGEVITLVSKANPKVKFTILSGHTHVKETLKISENVTCYIGGAREIVSLPQF